MPGWETIAVGVIVGVALIWAARASWRSLRSGSVCSDCADSGACPLAGDGKAPGAKNGCEDKLHTL